MCHAKQKLTNKMIKMPFSPMWQFRLKTVAAVNESTPNQAEGEISNEEIEQELLQEEQLSETEQLQQQVADANDNVLRIQAEMQNMRRRAERDVENAHKFALDKFSADLLPVVDNLERALAAINSDDDSQKAIAEGIELTLKSFLDVVGSLQD